MYRVEMSEKPSSSNPKPNNAGTGEVVLLSHNTTLTFDQNTFKMTFDVKGFKKEQIKVHRDGRQIRIDCHEHEELHHDNAGGGGGGGAKEAQPPPQTGGQTVKDGQAQVIQVQHQQSIELDSSDEIIDRTLHQIAIIPDGVDLKTVKIDIDTKGGMVVVVTGRTSNKAKWSSTWAITTISS